jgi:hypothetical protein
VGRFIYGDSNQSFDFDDRVLAHLRIVLMNKLRRRESFMLQFPSPHGVGWHSLWIGHAVPVTFQFYGGRTPALDMELVEQMFRDASGPDGLSLRP